MAQYREVLRLRRGFGEQDGHTQLGAVDVASYKNFSRFLSKVGEIPAALLVPMVGALCLLENG